MKSWQQLLLILENSLCLFNVFPATKYAHASIGESRKHCDSSIHAIHLYIHVSLIDGWVLNHRWNWVFMYLCILHFSCSNTHNTKTQNIISHRKYIHTQPDMWTHPHWVGVTLISRLSPAWKFKLHLTRITDVSPSPPLQKKKRKKEKTKAKLYLKRKRRLGNPLCIKEALNI